MAANPVNPATWSNKPRSVKTMQRPGKVDMPQREAALKESVTVQLDRFQHMYDRPGTPDEVKSQLKAAYIKELQGLIAQITGHSATPGTMPG